MIERFADKPEAKVIEVRLHEVAKDTVLTPIRRGECMMLSGSKALKVINRRDGTRFISSGEHTFVCQGSPRHQTGTARSVMIADCADVSAARSPEQRVAGINESLPRVAHHCVLRHSPAPCETHFRRGGCLRREPEKTKAAGN
jgi:hypothetical protein